MKWDITYNWYNKTRLPTPAIDGIIDIDMIERYYWQNVRLHFIFHFSLQMVLLIYISPFIICFVLRI